MDKLVVLLYDLSAVLIILMTVAYSAQKGFATGIFRLLGRLVALFGSAFLAKNGAELVYDQFLKTEVTAFLSQNLQGGQLTDIIAQLQAGLQQLPEGLLQRHRNGNRHRQHFAGAQQRSGAADGQRWNSR